MKFDLSSFIEMGVQAGKTLIVAELEEMKKEWEPVLSNLKVPAQSPPAPHPDTPMVKLPAAHCWLARNQVQKLHPTFAEYAGSGEYCSDLGAMLIEQGFKVEFEESGV